VIIRKSPEEIDAIAASGDIVVRTLRLLERMVRAGVTTADLDDAAEKFIRAQGGVPTFKGYHGFPASICASPNSMVVHGIPGPYALERGDVISLDVGVTLDGWVADAAHTFAVGSPGALVLNLLEGTRDALFAGIEHAAPGNRLGDVSHAIQQAAESRGLAVVRTLVGHGVGRDMHEDPQIPNFGEPGTGPELEEGMVLAIVRTLVGHGVGRDMHEDPQIPNFGEPGTGPELEEGMVLAIEPMTTAGGPAVRAGNDGWAIYARDGSMTAHFEFTVAVTAEGPRVLTPWHRPDGDPGGVGNITRCARVT
jgi:methionyl aminopeptidase